MMHYYGDTLEAAAEELERYTSLMEDQTAVLDHYKNVMDIIGEGQDYEKMGEILEAQAETIGNEAKVAEENYNMLRSQADARKAEYDKAVADGLDQSEIDAYK
jgi:anthranilate/para-aminobenzoate synthase component I